jgi:hypothetical protein
MSIVIGNLIQRIITMNFYNLENDDIFLHELSKKKGHVALFEKNSIICIILIKWLFANFSELGSITILVQDKNSYSINEGRRGSLES